MATGNYAATALQSEGTQVEVSTDAGVTWRILAGASSVSVTGGEAETRTVRDLADREEQLTGSGGVPTVSIPIGIYNPQLGVHRSLKTAKENGTDIHVRWTTRERTLRSYTGTDNTVAVAIGGVVTFDEASSGGSRPYPNDRFFRLGVGIKAGGNTYIVNEISDDTRTATVTVINSDGTAVTTALAATEDYSLVKPSLRRPGFIARIVNFDVEDIGEQSMLTTTLDVAPNSALPNWEIVTA